MQHAEVDIRYSIPHKSVVTFFHNITMWTEGNKERIDVRLNMIRESFYGDDEILPLADLLVIEYSEISVMQDSHERTKKEQKFEKRLRAFEKKAGLKGK